MLLKHLCDILFGRLSKVRENVPENTLFKFMTAVEAGFCLMQEGTSHHFLGGLLKGEWVNFDEARSCRRICLISSSCLFLFL